MNEHPAPGTWHPNVTDKYATLQHRRAIHIITNDTALDAVAMETLSIYVSLESICVSSQHISSILCMSKSSNKTEWRRIKRHIATLVSSRHTCDRIQYLFCYNLVALSCSLFVCTADGLRFGPLANEEWTTVRTHNACCPIYQMQLWIFALRCHAHELQLVDWQCVFIHKNSSDVCATMACVII